MRGVLGLFGVNYVGYPQALASAAAKLPILLIILLKRGLQPSIFAKLTQNGVKCLMRGVGHRLHEGVRPISLLQILVSISRHRGAKAF